MDKQAFKAQAKKQIDEVIEKIDTLEAKSDQVRENLKDTYQEQIRNLKSQKEVLKNKYASMEDAAEEKWDEFKEAFAEGAESFQEGVSKLTAVFK
jgi:DNA-binding transcriptional regulator GbsR (MarR family)